MRIVRGLGIAVALLIAALLATAGLARLSDGPIFIFPGGALEAGELVKGAEPDWSFASDIPELELQLLDPPRSRITWLMVHDKRLFIVSGYMDTTFGKLWKKWPAEAERDGRAVIRVDGKRYERTIVRIHDRPVIEALAVEVQRKYGVPLTAEADTTGAAWFFELLPR